MAHQSAIDAVMSGAYVALNTTAFTGLAPLYKYRVPPGTATPYAVLQNPTEMRQDVFGGPGKNLTFQVHIISEALGAAPYTTLSKAIELLHQSTSFTASGHDTMIVQYETSESYDETVDNVLTRHVVGIFRAQVWQS